MPQQHTKDHLADLICDRVETALDGQSATGTPDQVAHDVKDIVEDSDLTQATRDRITKLVGRAYAFVDGTPPAQSTPPTDPGPVADAKPAEPVDPKADKKK